MQANHEETLRASQELAAKQQELAEARKRQLEALAGSAGAQHVALSLFDLQSYAFMDAFLVWVQGTAEDAGCRCAADRWSRAVQHFALLVRTRLHICSPVAGTSLVYCAGAAAGQWPTSPGALAAAGGFGSPGTPGFAAAAAAGTPAATPAGSAAAAAAVANQAPAQIAAALHAQGKTYEDLVHMYADMVSHLLQLDCSKT